MTKKSSRASTNDKKQYDRKNKTSQKRMSTIVKQIKSIQPIWIIAVFLIIISGMAISGFWMSSTAKVKEQVIRARVENEASFDKMRDSQVAALREAGVIATSMPNYSSKVDACYVTHSDSGWVANNWYQDCYIRYVDLFSIEISQADARQKLRESGNEPFGVPYTFQPQECDKMYEQGSEATLLYLDWNVPKNIAASSDCKVPKPTQGIFTVNGPIVLDKELELKFERSFDVNEVDKTKRYIGLQSDHHYYHESLGCGFGIACPSPREEAITGF